MKVLMCIFFWALCFVVCAGELEDSLVGKFTELKQGVQETAAAAEDQLRARYVAMLQRLERRLQSQSDLDGLLAVRAERERFSEDRKVEDADAEQEDLARLQRGYLAEMRKLDGARHERMKSLWAVFDERLNRLQMKYTQDDDLEQAVQVRTVRERCKEDEAVKAALAYHPPEPTPPRRPSLPRPEEEPKEEIKLAMADAARFGGVKLENGSVLGHWSGEDARAVWELSHVQPGMYDVYISWKMSMPGDLEMLVLPSRNTTRTRQLDRVPDDMMRRATRVELEGNHEDENEILVGSMSLSPLNLLMLFRREDGFTNLNLQEIRLVPK